MNTLSALVWCASLTSLIPKFAAILPGHVEGTKAKKIDLSTRTSERVPHIRTLNVGHGHVELDVEQVKHICRRFYEMDSLLPHDTTIFLHCSCGRNRSCTVAVALMMGALCVSFNECLARLRLRRQQRGSELSSTDSRVKATPIGIRVRSQEMLRATPPSVFARSSIVSPDTRNYACTGQQHVQIDHHGLQDAASDDSGQSTSQHSTLRITRRKRKTVESPILRYW